MDNTHQFSQIRIGNRVVYNGVNGDAFSFGEKPPTVSSSGDTQTSQLRTTVGATDSAADSPDVSRRSSIEEARGTTSYVTRCELFLSEENCPTQRQLPVSVAETKSFSLAQTNKHQLLQLKGLTRASPMSVSAFLLPPQSPAAVGLPPILPPPPAAHLPPPLPSRPPSAVPSPSSSLSSLLSFKNDDKSFTTPPPSPTQPLETMDADEYNAVDNGTSFRNFFFRTSGTIKVEAPSRDLPHSPPLPPLSPPPLPLPLTVAPPLSTPLTAPKPARISIPRRCSESQGSSETTAVIATSSSPIPTPQFYTASSTSSKNDSEEEERDLVDNYDDTEVSNYRINSATDEIPEGSLVATRDRENVFSKRKPSSSSEKSDANRQIIPPEFDSIRKQSMTYADVISSVLMFYKLSKGSKKKKIPYIQTKLEKASLCRKCDRQFGFTRFRYHCSRCKKAFCDTCIPVVRVDNVEQEDRASSMSRVCDTCSEEIAYETSRGTYRGLWSEFKTLRDEARAHRGLDVTSSNIHRTLESQSMLDVTPGLTSLCLRFLVDVHHQLEKQPRHKFLANYLHFENPGQNKVKSKTMRSKECQACNRQLRMLTEIHDCSLCEQTFCISCTYRTLQLYLAPGTDLKGEIRIQWIQFHVKNNEMDDGKPSEASETYRVCADCEDVVMRNFLIYDFNRKIPELEAEMFDLQRQIDHALTYGLWICDLLSVAEVTFPGLGPEKFLFEVTMFEWKKDPEVHGMKRWASAYNLYHGSQQDSMATNVKLANRLYGRYMRAYDSLNHMEPQTFSQKTLHKHIKQAMYEFYLKRRDQLKSTLGSDGSWTNNEVP